MQSSQGGLGKVLDGSTTQIYPNTEEGVTITLQTVQALCKLPGTVHALQHRLAITTKTNQSVKHRALPCGPGTPRLPLMLIRTPANGPDSYWQSLRKRHHKHMKVSTNLLIYKSHDYLFFNSVFKGNRN